VLLALKKRNIKSAVTLWHWTNPAWFAEKGGWTNKKASDYFANYVKKITQELGDLIDIWLVFNEPLVFTAHSYGNAEWPPKEKNSPKILEVIKNLIKAHKKSYSLIKNANNEAKIGIARHNVYFEPFNPKSFLDRFSVWIIRYFWNYYFLNKIKNYQDFIGLNYYHHNKIKFPAHIKEEGKIVSDIGWEIYPQGIYYVLKKLNQKYKKPIYILENGLADARDKLRKNFIKDHLFYVHKAIQEGVDVKGYFHWSLMDNFEWAKGFGPKFGLIEIDYKTMERKIRDSAYYYAEICKNNFLKF
jgi:beta-glucosidase